MAQKWNDVSIESKNFVKFYVTRVAWDVFEEKYRLVFLYYNNNISAVYIWKYVSSFYYLQQGARRVEWWTSKRLFSSGLPDVSSGQIVGEVDSCGSTHKCKPTRQH